MSETAMADRPLINDRALRDALARFATGVGVVHASHADGREAVMTINSFASVSLSPPLILWSVEKRASQVDVYTDAPRFTISILGAEHEKIGWACADAKLSSLERFPDDLRVNTPEGPTMDGAIAWFQCRRYAVYPGGDHHIILGEIVDFGHRVGPALLFHDSAFKIGH